jgi:hypothetical protein
VSHDAGDHWTEVFAAAAGLLGVALSPDGSRIAVGGPDGLWTANTADLSFTKVDSVRVSCLTWDATGLFVCADDIVDGFGLAVSRDEGHTLSPLLRFHDLVPAACRGFSSFDQECQPAWQVVADTIGVDASASANDGDAGVMSSSMPHAGGCSIGREERMPSAGACIGLTLAGVLIKRRRLAAGLARSQYWRNEMAAKIFDRWRRRRGFES